MRKKKREKIMLSKQSPILHLIIVFTALLFSACSVTQQGTDNTTKAGLKKEYSATYADALSSMKNGESKQAQKLLQQVINQQPDFSNAHVNLGIVFFKNNSLNEAENSFHHALRTNPENIYALNQLGILYRKQGKFSAAKSSYEKAIDINSDYALAYLNLGILYDLYLYDFPNAIKHYNKYQGLTENKDKQVEKWIIDLERRQNSQNEKKSK